MKPRALSLKLYLTSALVLSLFSIASIAVLYRAQTKQAETEMQLLLKSEVVSLSALVNAQPKDHFDFEISSSFMSQFSNVKPNEFFRFIQMDSGKVLLETTNSPSLNCSAEKAPFAQERIKNKGTYRTYFSIFKPEIDPDLKSPLPFEVHSLCLLVGIDEAPYEAAVESTLIDTVPVLIGIVLLAISLLIFFVSRVTKDLSKLSSALESSDFSMTHEFPELPHPETLEVIVVVEKLESLHRQASLVHKEMWLFLGRASHQLKTPITAMQSTLQVLLRKERSKEELIAAMKDLESAVAELGTLSKNLISASRVSFQESHRKDSLELSQFLREQAKLFEALASSYSQKLIVENCENISLQTNKTLLSEITGNLIDNAIRYSSREKPGSLTISWKTQGTGLEISFKDSGYGFPNSVVEQLFQPFASGNSAAGSGLGLATAKRAAQALGGDLRLVSTGASGSVLSLTLKTSGQR